jgi:hypothetical protein
MIDVKQTQPDAWDPALKPIGYGDRWPEDFQTWWQRHRERLANLNTQIAEQWVYRHWSYSPFKFLPLERLTWRKEQWTTQEVLGRVHMEYGGPMIPDFDYDVMQESSGGPKSTAHNWQNGTWDMPLLVLETPGGIDCYDGKLPEIRFVLIEGSKRMRYLNAVHARREATGPHALYILELR